MSVLRAFVLVVIVTAAFDAVAVALWVLSGPGGPGAGTVAVLAGAAGVLIAWQASVVRALRRSARERGRPW